MKSGSVACRFFLVMCEVFGTRVYICIESFPQFFFDLIYCFFFSVVSKIIWILHHHSLQTVVSRSLGLNSSIHCSEIKRCGVTKSAAVALILPAGTAVTGAHSLCQKLPEESNFPSKRKKKRSHRSSETSAILTHLSS